MRVTVAIPSWNSLSFLKLSLSSHDNQTFNDYEIVVIDNGSTDGSSRFVADNFPDVRLIRNRENLGFCVACNQGVEAGSGEYILILNSDTKLAPDFIEHALSVFYKDDRIGIVTGKILRFDEKTIDSTGQFPNRSRRAIERGYNLPDDGQFDTPGYVFSGCGAAVIYKREMLEDIAMDSEYFDEDYFAFYEDLDLAWRAQLRGWKAYYEPKAVAYHYRGGSAGARKGLLGRFEFSRRPRYIQKHIWKNGILTIIKNDDFPSILRDLPFILLNQGKIAAYAVFFRPRLLIDFVSSLRTLKGAFRKRRIIQSRRLVNREHIRRLISGKPEPQP